ncbi:MAG: hypothetical protein ACE5G5_04145 [Candidatus Methylomirabilales bacterium]
MIDATALYCGQETAVAPHRYGRTLYRPHGDREAYPLAPSAGFSD